MKTYTQTHNYSQREIAMQYIYRFLNNISNTVGQTITEYHWREACELMKRMEDEELVNAPEYEHEEVSQKYFTKEEAIQFMAQQGIVCDHDEDYEQYIDDWFEYVEEDKYIKVDDNEW